MPRAWRRFTPWILGWTLLVLAGSFALVRLDIAQRRAAFETDARIAHRLLSQRAAQHEGILGTLVLMSGESADRSDRTEGSERTDRPEARLPALYPQLVAVSRRDGEAQWPEPALAALEEESRKLKRAVSGLVDAERRQFTLLLAGAPASFALRVDLDRMVPWDAWPLQRDGPVSVSLTLGPAVVTLQPGARPGDMPAGLTPGFVFTKTLDSPAQPFELHLHRATGPIQWPWPFIAGWIALVSFGLFAWAARRRVVRERRRAAEMTRISNVARLNALGELAAGMAHELNQPLTAVLASTQAARRLLDDQEPDVDTVRDALTQAAGQARRAADVVARLRSLVETPEADRVREPVALDTLLRHVLELLEPQLRAKSIIATIEGEPVVVMAQPVALEQIVHNLVGNAMQALDTVFTHELRITLSMAADGERGILSVIDNGPGIPPESVDRVFEPFYTTREGGLGLGLSLCETLAQSMDGRLVAANVEPTGAAFILSLPLAKTKEEAKP